MSLSLTGVSNIPFQESNNTPGNSYTSQGYTIRYLTIIKCGNNTFWVCTDASDQNNLQWTQL